MQAMHAMRRLSPEQARRVMHGLYCDDSSSSNREQTAVALFTDTDTITMSFTDVLTHIGSLALQAARAFADDSPLHTQQLMSVTIGDVHGLAAWVIQASPRDGFFVLPLLAAVEPGIVIVDVVVPVSGETVHCQAEPPTLTFHPRLITHNCLHLLTDVPVHQWAATFNVPPGDTVPAPAPTVDYSLPAQLLLPVTLQNVGRIRASASAVLFNNNEGSQAPLDLCAADNVCLFDFITHGQLVDPPPLALDPEQLALLLQAFVPLIRHPPRLYDTLATWLPPPDAAHQAVCEMIAVP